MGSFVNPEMLTAHDLSSANRSRSANAATPVHRCDCLTGTQPDAAFQIDPPPEEISDPINKYQAGWKIDMII
jgi:hypothetical protein